MIVLVADGFRNLFVRSELPCHVDIPRLLQSQRPRASGSFKRCSVLLILAIQLTYCWLKRSRLRHSIATASAAKTAGGFLQTSLSKILSNLNFGLPCTWLASDFR
jgi:hypothetical protein